MEFKDKARIVAEQYDKWEVPIALLSKGENIYDLIERLYVTLEKYPVDGETYNQWIARVAVDGYSHYKQKMGKRLEMSKEERERRYQEHQKKFLDK